MQLRSQKCEVLYRNLSLKTRNRAIFENVTGKVGGGQMVALLGTSGAGKTSLLNSIAGRISPGLHLTGEILVNGKPRDIKSWPQIVGYVEQEFHTYENQTILETFLVYSRLKLLTEDQEFISDLLKVLNLEDVKNNRICELSGGELKRVSIGVELIGNPSILFLDEPTSGLDSFNALSILETLSNLRLYNKSVLITIHQPSSKMLTYFDSIILMGQGSIIFEGKYSDSVKFFEDNGYKCPEMTNPTDFFLDTISLNNTSLELRSQSQETINKLKRAWAGVHKKYEVETVDEIGVKAASVNYCTFLPLYRRNISNYLRRTTYIKIEMAQKVVFTLLLGLTYLNLGYSQRDIQSRVGVIFFILINGIFGVMGPIFNVFPAEKKIINRERKSGCYDGFSMYYSKYLSELPFILVYYACYLVAVYWMVNLNENVGRFVIYILIQLFVVCFSVGFAFTIGTIAPTQATAQTIGSTVSIFFVIYGGAFNNPSTIPIWLRWLIWISPINYGFRASMNVLFQDTPFPDSEGGGGGYAFENGNDVLEFYGLTEIGIWPSIFVLWGFTLLFTVLGASVLHYTTRVQVTLESKKKGRFSR